MERANIISGKESLGKMSLLGGLRRYQMHYVEMPHERKET